MKQNKVPCQRSKGFTLLELLIVIVIVATLSAIALPSFADWVDSVEHRKTARHVLLLLREARNKAITTNREYRVEFDNINNSYRMTRGNRVEASLEFTEVIYDWFMVAPGIRINANIESIHCNPNGTVNAGTIRIQDRETGQARYEVRIARTGRMRIPDLF